jgi:mannosidase alpha-like ER degradation enhancer 2
MTPVDALDTMFLMGLDEEAASTQAFIIENLSFDKDIFVSNFETTIRLLGGLLASYQLSGNPGLLSLAEGLGIRLLPAFDSPTGIPYRFVNLKSGQAQGSETNPAEAGTLLLEFGTLSKLTNKPVFYDKAKRALMEIFERRSPIGLVGQRIHVETGEWINPNSHIGGEIDSYYEYLLKSWLLFGDRDCEQMWLESISAINQYLADETESGFWHAEADMHSGVHTATSFGALHAFFPAVLALSGDMQRAKSLQASCFRMWTEYGIEPERLNYKTMDIENPVYLLRPEVIESAYYLYRLSGDPQYLRMGETCLKSLIKYCKTNAGYASLSSVVTKEKSDRMESFLLSETFKYLYLLFAPPEILNFEEVIFNTEAHPIAKSIESR